MISRLLSFFGVMLYSVCALAVDWEHAATRDIVFFYPGTASWEKLLRSATHHGSKGVRAKMACSSCHAGDEANMGEHIAGDAQHRFYRAMRTPGSIAANLKIALDDTALHFRFQLPSGVTGRLSLTLDDGSYPLAAISGCWSACHDDARGMASASELNLGKYLSISRTKNTCTGGGDSLKSRGELDALLGDGQFLELLGSKFAATQAVALQGYVLEARHMREAGQVAIGTSVNADAERTVVEIDRPLAITGDGVKSVSRGGTYSVAFALHNGDAEGAGHWVTFAQEFSISSDGAIVFIDNLESD